MNTKKHKNEEKEIHLPVRVSESLAQRVLALIPLERERTGYKVSRSDILRRAITLGIAQMERETGASK